MLRHLVEVIAGFGGNQTGENAAPRLEPGARDGDGAGLRDPRVNLQLDATFEALLLDEIREVKLGEGEPLSREALSKEVAPNRGRSHVGKAKTRN